MSEGLEALAEKLTEAQREAVFALHPNDWKSWPDARLKAMMDGLGRYGLSGLRALGVAEKGPPWHLTSRGLDLRQFLRLRGGS